MGIGKQQGRAALDAIKAGTTRAQRRAEVADAAQLLIDWLAKFDAQENTAAADFAATKATQFKNFTDALPDPDQLP